MYQATDEFIAGIDTAPILAHFILEDGTIIPEDPTDKTSNPIQSITFTGGSSDSRAVTIGCAVSSSVEITLSRELLSAVPSGKQKITVEIGMELNGGIEWIPMGVYIITEISKDDDSVVLQCMDDIAALLDVEYQTLDGFDFSAGVDGKAFLQALCDRRGVTADMSDLPDVTLTITEPTDYTERQIIAALAGLWGKFACMDRGGTLRFLWYSDSGVTITPDEYYDGECTSGEKYTVAYLKCYNSTLEETLVEGDADQEQGMYFACPWCDQEQLAELWESLDGYAYDPIDSIHFIGNPLLDPWDIITVETLDGGALTVPMMQFSHDYDGGLSTTVQASGDLSGVEYTGPVERETKRTTAKIIKKLDSIEMSVTETESNYSALTLKVDGISGTVSSVEKTLSDVQEAVLGTITNVEVQYALGTSTETAPTSGWSTAAPEWEAGKYMWQKTVTTYSSGTVQESDPTCIAGATGSTGEAGANGEDAITLIIDSSNGDSFKNSKISTTLTVSIIVAGNYIDCSRKMYEYFGDSASLQWETRGYGEDDYTTVASDDPRLSDNGFIFTLTTADVNTKIVCRCYLDY